MPLRVLAWMYAMMVPYRILMTKVYSRTGSLLIGVLMHATFTGGQALLEPIGISHQQQLVWWGAAGVALWVVVGLVIAFDRPSVNATLEEEKPAKSKSTARGCACSASFRIGTAGFEPATP